MQPDKIEAIQTWPPCWDLTELRALLHTCGYYRRFVENFAGIALPWGKEFVLNGRPNVRKRLKNLSFVLWAGPYSPYVLTKGYILDADASGFGLGAILSQTQFGTERLIAYSSRTLNRAE